MTMVKLARLSEALENTASGNEKAQKIAESLSSFKDKEALLKILSGDYPNNNIGNKRALTWIATAFNVFDEEIETAVGVWGDLGEAVYHFDETYTENESDTLKSLLTMLTMDCSSIKSDSFARFREAFNNMDALSKKWFVRYWLRTPRNGVSESTVNKAMVYHYGSGVKEFLLHRKASELPRYEHLMYADTNTDWMDMLPKINWFGRHIKPMLAKSIENRPLPENYIVDTKYDGNRYQIHMTEKEVIFYNRSGKIVNCFPDIETKLLEDFNTTGVFVFDSEIYPTNPDGTPAPHQKMGTRVHSKDILKATIECPVRIVFFDTLVVNGESIMQMPYSERLKVTKSVWENLMVDELPDDIESAYATAINRGYEGVMIKDLDAPYQTKRTDALLKHKPPRIEIDAVIVSAKYGEGKRHDVFGSFEIAVLDENREWVSLGSVGTGLSDGDLVRLTTLLKRVVDTYEKGVFNLLPRIVLEVTADAITQNDDGGYGLRFPRVLRIRDDKGPMDCTEIGDVI